jgi:hypothetical protein
MLRARARARVRVRVRLSRVESLSFLSEVLLSR